MAQAVRKALRAGSGRAVSAPAMSYAVPWAGVAIGTGSPPSTVTPRSKPSSLIAIWPWSWYMLTAPSN